MWNKIMANKQEQNVVDGSIALQADQIKDVTINNGVPITEIIPICNQIFELNFPRLRDEAAKIAYENVEKFSSKLQVSLNKNIDVIVLEKLADPDLQFCLNQSLQLVARHGEKINPELLVSLIQRKMLEDTNDFDNLICNQAINILDKITGKNLKLIVFIGLVVSVLPKIFTLGKLRLDEADILNVILRINDFFEKFYHVFYLGLNSDYLEAKYLESLGIINFDNMPFSFSSFSILYLRFGGNRLYKERKFSEDDLKDIVKNNAHKYYELLEQYDKIFKYNYVSLSFIGEAILKSYLCAYDLYSEYELYKDFDI